jgi:hypothetical protein
MRRPLSALVALTVTLTATGAAQDTGPLVRYGKWALAAGAI